MSAAMIIGQTVKSMDEPLRDKKISASTLKRKRKKVCKEMTEKNTE